MWHFAFLIGISITLWRNSCFRISLSSIDMNNGLTFGMLHFPELKLVQIIVFTKQVDSFDWCLLNERVVNLVFR